LTVVVLVDAFLAAANAMPTFDETLFPNEETTPEA
jgi:hypothetical protein